VDITLWIELGLFVLLMALSGFFSSSETAMFSLSSLQIEQMRSSKNPRVELIERMLSEPRRLIVTILIGNEFVNVAASVISAAIVIDLLGAQNKFINLFIMVPMLLLFGEITPKTLAIRNNVAFATFESPLIEFFARLIKPIRWLVRKVADWFITFIVGKERSRGNIITEDMVRTLAHEAVGEGTLDKIEAQYIDHIFEFGDRRVEDVMTHRSQVFFLPSDMPLKTMGREARRTQYTKIPVYEEHRDTILGILHARDLLAIDIEQTPDDPRELKKVLREPYFVPESKPAAELFASFRERRQSIALTVDEFGGVTGLVTMEDLLECIFGDIPSHSDGTEPDYVAPLDADRYSIEGTMPVDDFNDRFNAELPTGIAETVGGLILHEYGELPAENTTIELTGRRFTVSEVEDNRIKEVVVETSQQAQAAVSPEKDTNTET
jgi:CBS domain containing-hemolysin-like protein